MVRHVINERLRQLGIRPITLARMVGCSPQYIYELLRGDKRWNETMIERVCGALRLRMCFVPDESNVPEGNCGEQNAI